MVDALDRALARIHSVIPNEVLEAAFEPWNYDISLDRLIIENVILKKVRDDISLRGGKVFQIILNMDWCKYTSSPSPYALGIAGSYSTYRIPPEAREHRDISCILQVKFPYSIGTSATGTFYNDCSVKGNTLGGLACAALQEQTGANLLVSPTGIIRPGNVVQLSPPQMNFVPWDIRVRLKYDDNFSGMDVSTVYPFARLCEFAVKSYIYTKLIFKVESNMVFKGAELGVMRDQVQSYQDATEKYDEELILVGGAEVLDPERLKGVFARMVPRR